LYELIRATKDFKGKDDQRYFQYASCFQIIFDIDYNADGFHKILEELDLVYQSDQYCVSGDSSLRLLIKFLVKTFERNMKFWLKTTHFKLYWRSRNFLLYHQQGDEQNM